MVLYYSSVLYIYLHLNKLSTISKGIYEADFHFIQFCFIASFNSWTNNQQELYTEIIGFFHGCS